MRDVHPARYERARRNSPSGTLAKSAGLERGSSAFELGRHGSPVPGRKIRHCRMASKESSPGHQEGHVAFGKRSVPSEEKIKSHLPVRGLMHYCGGHRENGIKSLLFCRVECPTVRNSKKRNMIGVRHSLGCQCRRPTPQKEIHIFLV